MVDPSFHIRILLELHFITSFCNSRNIKWHLIWYAYNNITKPSFTNIQSCSNQDGIIKSNQKAKILARIAEGQVIIYHSRFVINFN